jgi:hypothetical protein
MTNTNVRFTAVNINKSTLQNTAVTNGCVYFVNDTKELFFDFNSNRNEVKDILILQKESERTNILFAPLNKFYFVLETKILWVYKDGTWYQVSHNMEDYYNRTQIDTLLAQKQDKLIAGAGVFIENNVITAVGFEASYNDTDEALVFSAPTPYTEAYNIADRINGES